MNSRIRSAALSIAGWIPNLFVLGLLGAIGWWGHHNHWTWHGYSRESSSPIEASDADGKPRDVQENASFSSDGRQAFHRLPAIEFSSVQAARDCGILTTVAHQRSMADVVQASGVVGYDQTRIAQLSVRVPGVVWRAEKHLGDIVEAGDVLMVVDSAEVGAAKASLLEAAVGLRLKMQTRQRLEAVQSAVSERNLREAEAAEDVAKAQRFNALQRLLNLGFTLGVDEIDGLTSDVIAERLHWLGLPESLHRDTPSANLIPLLAPFAGVITQCDVVRGEVVDPLKSQYTIADTRHMWINLDIRHEDCARVRLGTVVVFKSDGGVAPVAGTLRWIGTEINPRTRTVQARAEMNNPLLDEIASEHSLRRVLHANAFGMAEIVVTANPETLVVPNDALHWQWELSRDIVFVPAGDGRRFEPRIVRKGLVQDEWVQVLEGLSAGERVVTGGSRILLSELSETLQERWGENDAAVRDFGIRTAVE
jgi:multidrug efflux pump subunit AcrA (membrane-fusion protein)